MSSDLSIEFHDVCLELGKQYGPDVVEVPLEKDHPFRSKLHSIFSKAPSGDQFIVENVSLLPNYRLWQRYQLAKGRLQLNHSMHLDDGKLRLRTEDSVVFHGTSERVLPYILKDGFLRSCAHNGLLGSGLYFAKDLAKSDNYASLRASTGTKLMLICCVVFGRMYDNRVTRIVDSESSRAPEGFHSVKDHFRIAKEYVLYDEEHVLPIAAIRYHDVPGRSEASDPLLAVITMAQQAIQVLSSAAPAPLPSASLFAPPRSQFLQTPAPQQSPQPTFCFRTFTPQQSQQTPTPFGTPVPQQFQQSPTPFGTPAPQQFQQSSFSFGTPIPQRFQQFQQPFGTSSSQQFQHFQQPFGTSSSQQFQHFQQPFGTPSNQQFQQFQQTFGTPSPQQPPQPPAPFATSTPVKPLCAFPTPMPQTSPFGFGSSTPLQPYQALPSFGISPSQPTMPAPAFGSPQAFVFPSPTSPNNQAFQIHPNKRKSIRNSLSGLHRNRPHVCSLPMGKCRKVHGHRHFRIRYLSSKNTVMQSCKRRA